jgi:hypothetical protein
VSKRTAGSLTHKDFGKHVQVAGYPGGILCGVHHVAVVDGSAEPFTRILFEDSRTSLATKGIQPDAAVTIQDASTMEALK